jgi:hypothetical protein
VIHNDDTSMKILRYVREVSDLHRCSHIQSPQYDSRVGGNLLAVGKVVMPRDHRLIRVRPFPRENSDLRGL